MYLTVVQITGNVPMLLKSKVELYHSSKGMCNKIANSFENNCTSWRESSAKREISGSAF